MADASMATHVTTIVERGYAQVVDANGEPLGDEGIGGSKGGGGRGGGKGCNGSGKGNSNWVGERIKSGRGNGSKSSEVSGGATGGGGRFMSATAVGMALVEGLGAVDTKLVRPELRASMEQMVAKVASGEALKTVVVKEGLGTFKQQFERLKKSMHLLVPHFGELGDLCLDKEGEGGQDELIRLELLAQAGQQLAAEWKRARDVEMMLEVQADVADATERVRRHRDRDEAIDRKEGASAGGADGSSLSAPPLSEAERLLRSLFTPASDGDEDEDDATSGSRARELFEIDAAAAARSVRGGKGGHGRDGRGARLGSRAVSDRVHHEPRADRVPPLSEWLAARAPPPSSKSEEGSAGGADRGGGERCHVLEARPLRGKARARALNAEADAGAASERARLQKDREEALHRKDWWTCSACTYAENKTGTQACELCQTLRPATSAADELKRMLFYGGGVTSAHAHAPVEQPGAATAAAGTLPSSRSGSSGAGHSDCSSYSGGGSCFCRGDCDGRGDNGDGRSSRVSHADGSDHGSGPRGGVKQAVVGGGVRGEGGKGGRKGNGKGRGAPVSTSAGPLSRWEQMEKERTARVAADGGARTAFSGGLASTHGLSEEEREKRGELHI